MHPTDRAAAGTGPRIAILGIHLEANRFAPVTVRANFDRECWVEGEAISRGAYQPSHLPLEIPGFYRRMDETGPWTPVPIILAAAQPGGPIVQEVFDEFIDKATAGLAAALPVDAVYICSHGGSSTTADDDNDGTLALRVRAIVGPSVPIVVTHDLHCGISDRMVETVDGLIAYKTNPHVDHRETAAKAADFLRRKLAGMVVRRSFIRLPLSPPGVAMSGLAGPYADLLALARDLTTGPIFDISVTGGFVLTDLPKCGFTIGVIAEGDQDAADRVARQVAEAAWADRQRYLRPLTTLDAGVALARAAAAGDTPPVLLADISDNPGGGARGNTTWMLRALHEARIPGVVVGLFTDEGLAETARQTGVGTRFHAVFNAVESEFAWRFEAGATVEAVSDGSAIGRRGRDAGREIMLGPSALLRLDDSGLRVVVTSLREQLCDPVMLEMFGIDIAVMRCIVLKSRGHFRAGFDEFFPDERIFEVDTPGLTSAVLSNYRFQGIRRPFFPLDPETTWQQPDDCGVR